MVNIDAKTNKNKLNFSHTELDFWNIWYVAHIKTKTCDLCSYQCGIQNCTQVQPKFV